MSKTLSLIFDPKRLMLQLDLTSKIRALITLSKSTDDLTRDAG